MAGLVVCGTVIWARGEQKGGGAEHEQYIALNEHPFKSNDGGSSLSGQSGRFVGKGIQSCHVITRESTPS